MPVQVIERRIVAIALERLSRAPLDEDQDLARLEVTLHAVAEPAQSHDSPAVSLDLACRPSGVGQVLLPIGDVEQVQSVDGAGHEAKSHPTNAQPHGREYIPACARRWAMLWSAVC